MDEGDAQFRTKVEKIRQMGGDAWLTMLGEMQDTHVSNVKVQANEQRLGYYKNIVGLSPIYWLTNSIRVAFARLYGA